MSMLRQLETPDILDISLKRTCREIDGLLDELLTPPGDARDRLYLAIRHAAIGGGKRMRPLLVLASADLFDVTHASALRTGLAVECIHVHSLIHDDLPCMDDDDTRRGKPTVHKAFDEATAVLAGDALHALAFEILADPSTHSDGAVRSALVRDLAAAAGAAGMAGGQMLDLLPEAITDLEGVVRLQRLKTGALISWCVEAGATLGRAPDTARINLRGYGQCVGLAFQIADDLLDFEGNAVAVGKRLRMDGAAGSVSFVSLLGPERARSQARALVDQAKDHLRPLGKDVSLLRSIADYALARDR